MTASHQFSLEASRDILSAICLSGERTLDASSIPSGIQNTEALLSTLFDSIDSISPLMTLDESKNIIIIKDMKEHVFPKSQSIFFASKIAPIAEMGVFQIERFPFDPPTESLILPTSWPSGDFNNIEVAKETVDSEAMVYFPHIWLHLFQEDCHRDKINPDLLLQEIISLRENVPDETALRVIKFLIQHITNYAPPFGFRTIKNPVKKGKSTWNLLLSGIRMFQDVSSNDHPSYETSSEADEEDEIVEVSKTHEETISKHDEDPLSPNSKRILLMMKAHFSSLNETMIKNLIQVSEAKSSNVLRLEDKEGFLKKLPDHAKDIFIHLRASPSVPDPTELDPVFASALTKVKTKSHAFDQILFQVAKNANKKDIDCLIDSQTLENFFKFGEVRNKRPIISFDKSFGLNNFALGPSAPSKGTFTVSSDAGNKHISFIAGNVSELITAYRNLKYFVNFITGSDDSFASQGITKLIAFLDDNSITIKESAKELPNFIAELQIQTGNTWARFVSNCAHEKPSAPPDFSHFIDAIESGRTFATVLRSVSLNSNLHHQNKRQKLDKNETKIPNAQVSSKNANPQLKIEGVDDTARRTKFRMSFPDTTTIKNLNLPLDQNKPYCLRFAILHECKSKFCKFSHKPMPSEVLNKFLEICSAKNLGISKNLVKGKILKTYSFSMEEHASASSEIMTRESIQPEDIISHPFRLSSTLKRNKLESNIQSDLIKRIKFAISSKEDPLNISPMTFQFTQEAALKNAMVLNEFEFSIEKMLSSTPFTSLHPGSEFHKLEHILPLLELHDYGTKVTSYISSGISYAFANDPPFSDEDRELDIHEALNNNINNKSAITNGSICEKAFKKEVERGWSFVLPLSVAGILRDKINFIPLGTASQWTIDDKGNPKQKYRLTQDCSRLRKSGKSINSCMDPAVESECYFGGCLNRMLIRILLLRQRHPNKAILINKYDLDSAYRRMHVRLDHALLECWQWNDLMFINSRLPFGYEKACEVFSHVTDLVVDLAQWLHEDPSWDPSSLNSSLITNVPDPIYTNGNKELARPLQDNIDCQDAYHDGYIDDLMAIVVATSDNILQRTKHAVPLILDSLFRPTFAQDSNHLERVPLLAPDKLIAEGGLTESKTILGWHVDTANLRIKIPMSKAKRYLNDIDILIQKSEQKSLISAKDLEKLIGKLVHVSQIAKEGLMFLSRLRYRMKFFEKNKNKPYICHLQDQDIKDLLLWKNIIMSCVAGRDINMVVNTVPMFIFVSDAAESNGLGGWLSFGPAWRFELPDSLLGIFSSNILECVAAYWSLRLSISLVGTARIRGRVDNTATISWINRNRFDPVESPAHDFICRAIGELLLTSGSSLEIEHISASSNKLPDRREQQHRSSTVPAESRIAYSLQSANTYASNEKRTSAFEIWKRFIIKRSLDPFLFSCSRRQKIRICETFCDFLRYGELGGYPGVKKKASTIRNIISSQVGQVFQQHEIPSPFLDKNKSLRFSILKLLKSYENEDPVRNCQPALPLSFFEKTLDLLNLSYERKNDYNISLCQLTCIASFFGLRSVEYTSTHDKDPKTKRLAVDNVTFKFKNPSGQSFLHRQEADLVLFTFENQKNGIRNQTITRPKASNQCIPAGYCPVKITGALIDRIRGYNFEDTNPPINLTIKNGKPHFISTYEEMILNFKKGIAKGLGEDKIGFPPSRIGTHSMRVTFATNLFNQGYSDAIIMAEGRWESNAFLKYIRLNCSEPQYNVTEAIASSKNHSVIIH